MRLVLLVTALLCISINSFAKDRNGGFSAGVGAGFLPEAPWSQVQFRSGVDPAFLGTAFLRYNPAFPSGGLEFSYNYVPFLGSDIDAHVYLASFFWRFLPEKAIHPHFSIGWGLASVSSYFASGNADLAAFRLRLGADIEIQDRIELGAYLDHLTFFKNKANDPNAHVFGPVVSLIYTFGD